MMAPPTAELAQRVVQMKFASDIARAAQLILLAQIDPPSHGALDDVVQSANVQPIAQILVACAGVGHGGELPSNAGQIQPPGPRGMRADG
jgi:hypothetical protein